MCKLNFFPTLFAIWQYILKFNWHWSRTVVQCNWIKCSVLLIVFTSSNKSIRERSVEHSFLFFFVSLHAIQATVIECLRHWNHWDGYYGQIWRFIADLNQQKEKCRSLDIPKSNTVRFNQSIWCAFFCWWCRSAVLILRERLSFISLTCFFYSDQFLLCIQKV